LVQESRVDHGSSGEETWTSILGERRGEIGKVTVEEQAQEAFWNPAEDGL
jgi:hypothetical protein